MAPMPMSASSSITHPSSNAPCPTVTRLPTIVGRPSAQCSTALSWIDVSGRPRCTRRRRAAPRRTRPRRGRRCARRRRAPPWARGRRPRRSWARRRRARRSWPSRAPEARLTPLARGGQALAVVGGLQQRGLREALGEHAAAQVDVRGERAAGASRRRTRAGRGRASSRARAMATATASSPSSLSRPAARAASASRSSPPSRSSFARARPSSLTSRVTPPWVGTSPIRPSRNSTRARGEPTRQSHARASASARAGDDAVDRGHDRLLEALDRLHEVGQAVRDVAVGARVVELARSARGRRRRRRRRPRP